MEVVAFLRKSGVRYQLSEHLPVYSAQGLAATDDHILFQVGTHAKAARLNMEDYRKLVHPRVLDFRLQ